MVGACRLECAKVSAIEKWFITRISKLEPPFDAVEIWEVMPVTS